MTRFKLMERALLVIEGMTYTVDSEGVEPGEVPVGWKQKDYIAVLQKFASDCYCITHAATGKCCSGGRGDPWLELIERRAAELKQANIVDVDEVASQKKKKVSH